MASRSLTAAGHGALPLRVAISTRALFEVEAEHAIFEERGVEAYVEMQRSLKAAQMSEGVGFQAISRLLALNDPGLPPLVDVILVSRNAPEASLRAFASIERYGLKIVAGSFISGGDIAPLLSAWDVDLFLSKDARDVEAAHALGIAAAMLGVPPPRRREQSPEINELRIAFDGDAVVFSDESDKIYAQHGLQAFLRHEADRARDPMAAGPFGKVLRKLAALRQIRRSAGLSERLQMALVTARTAPAHARVVNTLAAWGTTLDEAHFVGESEKGRILSAFDAHIFFDDQERHVVSA